MTSTENHNPTNGSPSGSKIYSMGDVGPNAQVAQGEHIQQVRNALAGVPDSKDLEKQFSELLGHIAQIPDLDDETRDLALEKTQKVAEGLATAKEFPAVLKRALIDAKNFLTSAAKGVWEGLCKILSSEAAQKTISSIAEGTMKGTIGALIGGA